jgi:hypothetical protein
LRGRSSRPGARRGYSVVEVVIAASLTALILLGMAAVLSMAGIMETKIGLQSDTDQYAVKAMNRMTLEVREAVRVNIVAPYRFQIYYPTVDPATGYYDLTKPNYGYYVEYELADDAGNPSATGTTIWRKASTDTTGRKIVDNVKQFSVGFFPAGATTSIRMTVELKKTQGSQTGDTVMNQRVLYLRNYFAGN